METLPTFSSQTTPAQSRKHSPEIKRKNKTLSGKSYEEHLERKKEYYQENKEKFYIKRLKARIQKHRKNLAVLETEHFKICGEICEE